MRGLDGKKIRTFAGTLTALFLEHHIPRASAGLSYFLTLTVFPLLICLYHMLGSLFPTSDRIAAFLSGLLPENTMEDLLAFLRYVSANMSSTMLTMALTVMVTSASAAFRLMDNVMGEMRGCGVRYAGVFEILFSVVCALAFLAAIYVAALLIVTGKWFLDDVDRHLMFMNISDNWRWGRFALLFLLLFVMLSGVYRLTAPRDARPVRLLPGALLAAVTLLLASMVFSAFIGVSVRYPLVYGSLASVVVMMLWLYTCGNILFLGNAVNITLERMAD